MSRSPILLEKETLRTAAMLGAATGRFTIQLASEYRFIYLIPGPQLSRILNTCEEMGAETAGGHVV